MSILGGCCGQECRQRACPGCAATDRGPTKCSRGAGTGSAPAPVRLSDSCPTSSSPRARPWPRGWGWRLHLPAGAGGGPGRVYLCDAGGRTGNWQQAHLQMGFLGSGKLACVQPGTVLISNWKHPTVTKLHSGEDLVLQSRRCTAKLAQGVCDVAEVAAGRGTRSETRAVWWHRGVPCPRAGFAAPRQTLRVPSGRVQRVCSCLCFSPSKFLAFPVQLPPRAAVGFVR